MSFDEGMHSIDKAQIGLAAAPQVGNEARVVQGVLAERRGRHAAASQEGINFGEECFGGAHDAPNYRTFPILQEDKTYFPQNRELPIIRGMDAVRQMILERVPNLSETSKKIGRNHAYLQQFVHRGVPTKLPEDVREALAPVMGVDPDDLRPVNQKDGRPERQLAVSLPAEATISKRVKGAAPADAIPGEALVGERNLPVYGTAEGGRGALILTNDPVDWVVRPDPLLRVKDGYGIIVTGDSMTPEHKSGSMALVNPHLPPHPGDTCVFRSVSDEGTENACIKELRRWSDTTWYVRQHHPRKDFTLKRSEWQVCHVTVGNYKRR